MATTSVVQEQDCNTCRHHVQGSSLNDIPPRCWDCSGGSGSVRLRMWEPDVALVSPPLQARPLSEAKVYPLKSSKHPLSYAFDLAMLQVTSGKGQERHGKGFDSFWEQPWKSLADTHSVGFLTGQAAKKLQEAQGMDDPVKWEREMLGVLTYAAMAILYKTHTGIPADCSTTQAIPKV